MPSLNIQILISAVLGLLAGGALLQSGDDSLVRTDILYVAPRYFKWVA